MDASKLSSILSEYMATVPFVKKYCEDCLNVKRYGGNVVLMVVDASLVSLGINYFNVVVPKVLEFKRRFVDSNEITSLKDLSKYDLDELTVIWKNKRSWNVAKNISLYLSKLDEDDKRAIVKWARNSNVEGWKKDPIGKIRGVGINTYQYLRMMGGIDTVMPDKIVRRVFNEIFSECGMNVPKDDIEFIKKVEEIAKLTGYRAIELCWMTWFIHNDSAKIYESIL